MIRFFFEVISIRSPQTSHEVENVMKHEQIAGARERANLSRDINHVQRLP